MKEFNMEDRFQLVRQKDHDPSDVADLRDFFRKRRIKNYKIADVLECKPQLISMWFSGQQSTPAKWRTELEILRQRFIDWEENHGFMFNGPEHLLTINKPYDKIIITADDLVMSTYNKPSIPEISVCPYDSEGAKFGLHFNFYRECEYCELFKKCEIWSISHPVEYAQSIEDNQE